MDVLPTEYTKLFINFGRASSGATHIPDSVSAVIFKEQIDGLTAAAAPDTISSATSMVLRGFFNDDATGNAIAIDLYVGKDANNKLIFASQNAAEDAIGMRIWIEIPVTATGGTGDDAFDWATEGNTDLIPNDKLDGLLSQIMAGTNITIDDSTSGQITIAASWWWRYW